jgi:hypothetical protein
VDGLLGYAALVDEGFRPPPPAPAPPPPPSTGLRFLGITQCALGVFGLAGAPITVLTRLVARDPGSLRVQELLWDGWLGVWTYASLVIGTLLAFVLIAAGAGVLQGRPFGRTLSLAHAGGALMHVVLGQIIAVALLYPALWQLGSSGSAIERGGAVGGVLGGIVGSLFTLVLPAVELYVMTRPTVKEAFSR